jgi:hypothetical protein
MSKKDSSYSKVLKDIEKPSIKEVIKNLKEQMEAYKKQYEYYQTMYIKAQGGIEVLKQLEDSEKEGDVSL